LSYGREKADNEPYIYANFHR